MTIQTYLIVACMIDLVVGFTVGRVVGRVPGKMGLLLVTSVGVAFAAISTFVAIGELTLGTGRPGAALGVVIWYSVTNAGFTLEEIAELLRLDASGDRPRAREMARSRIEVLDAKIAELERARRSLAKLARECAASDEGPCPIIASFEGS